MSRLFIFYELKDEIRIGRGIENDIIIPSPYVSLLHCRIEKGIIYDLSKNGTYVNQQKILSQKLNSLDHIVIGNSHLLILFGGIFVDRSLKVNLPVKRIICKDDPSIRLNMEPFMLHHLDILVDAPEHPVKMNPTSLWFMIGPSITMILAMVMSFIVSSAHSYGSLFMVGGMGISMVLFPVLQRKQEKKKIIIENKGKQDRYVRNIKKIEEQIQTFLEKEKEYLFENHDQLHIGLSSQKADISYTLPKLSYEQEEYSDLIKELTKDRIIEHVPERVEIKEGQRILITGRYRWEYLYYLCLYALNRDLEVIFDERIDFISYLCKGKKKIYVSFKDRHYDYLIHTDDHSFFPSVSKNEMLYCHHLKRKYEINSLLDYLKIDSFEELDLTKRYKEHPAYSSLKVELSLDLILDLHEKGDGPHGLLAGMTGSGKSELIITMILLLSVNYSPKEVSFFLIDYKGGGMSEMFDRKGVRLPHIAGTVHNLDQINLIRSMYGLKEELLERQRIFNQTKERLKISRMDIDLYQQLYRENKIELPLSHLIIIVDEFAELKGEHGSLIEEIIHIARIGRSLGFHLLLTTQKPSGVVNQQIWSNTNFHICMKVMDSMDSMEVIHSKEAAYLKEKGEFILERNQSTNRGKCIYSGNPYLPRRKVERLPIEDFLHESEADALIHYLMDHGSGQASRLYMPILPQRLLLSSLTGLTIGLIDDYKHRRILPLSLVEGNYVIYGLDHQRIREAIQEKMKAVYFHDLRDEKVVIVEWNKEVEGKYEDELLKILQDPSIVVIALCKDLIRYSYQRYFTKKLILQDFMDQFSMIFNHSCEIQLKKIEGRGIILLDDFYPFMIGGKDEGNMYYSDSIL